MLYDDVLRGVGDFGRYQWLMVVCCALATLSDSLGVYGYVFVTIVTDRWCKDSTNITEDDEMDIKHSQCAVHDKTNGELSMSEIIEIGNKTSNSSSSSCLNGWTDGGATIIMEWDLVCDRSYLVGLTQTAFLAGMMIGVMVSGLLADRFGRFKTIAASHVVLVTSSIAVAFSNDVIMFSVLRFFQGAAGLSSESTVLIAVMEVVTPEWRSLVMAIRYICWMSGILLNVAAAYVFRQWRTIFLVIGVPNIIHLILLPFMLESPQWFHALGNKHQAECILRKIARRNGVRDVTVELDNINRGDHANSRENERCVKVVCNYPKLIGRMMLMTFIWVAVCLTYFGLTFTSVNLGDRFVNLAIYGAVELPVYIFLGVALDRLGRRAMTGPPIIMCGIVLLVTMALPTDSSWPLILLSTIGKAGVTLAYAVVYPFTAELFPTMLRNTALSFASACSRLGSLIAPQLAMMTIYNKDTPLAVFGVLSLLAGGLTFLLPETSGKALPESLQDGEDMSWRGNTKPKRTIIGQDTEGCTQALTNGTEVF